MKEGSAAGPILFAIVIMIAGWVTAASAAGFEGQHTPVSYRQALADATRVASLNPDWVVMRTAGDSMAPHYSDNAVLVVSKVEYPSLRPGMIVVYKDTDGDLVGHTLIAMTSEGWIARGQNNSANDPQLVTPENMLGAIFGIFHTSGFDTSVGSALPLVISKRY